ncbi:MAG TPA: ABC transporter permease [Clostridiaceae bacterium]|nr:ABC transporter permease [Clostridiaceae bacterium]
MMKKALLYIALTVIAFFMLTPLLWMLATSFSRDSVVVSTSLIPKNFTLKNYIEAWNFPRVFSDEITLGTFFKNSIITTFFITALGLFIDSLAGYVLARKRFLGRKIFFYLALITLMIPFYVVVVPMFLIMKNLRWINTYQGLITPSIASGFGVYMFKQYFQTIPYELEEAAKMDGYSDFRIYFSIIIPLSIPAFGTMAILKSMWAWDEFFWPLIITTDIKMKTLQVALTMFRGLNVTQWGLLTAGMTMATIPIIIIYIFLQRYFVSGLTAGSLKA